MQMNMLFRAVSLTATAVLIYGQTPAPSKPVEPIATILEAFRDHAIVALGNVEFRGNEQSHAFQLSLIRDRRFATVVNDIVVEFGNARDQELMDRFVHGDEIAPEQLRRVWQNTTQIEYEWDLPIYEDFFRTVRRVNASLPPARQLRVLLADPPVDWDRIHSIEDLLKATGDRDAYAAQVVQHEVIAKHRRALLIFGRQHFLRTQPGSITVRIEKDGSARVFTVAPETRRDLSAVQPDVASWQQPSLAILRGTALGAASGSGRGPVRMEDEFDAILYLGPPSSMTESRISPVLCTDTRYMEMRIARLNLVPPPKGAPFTLVDRLRESCATSGR
jgi:hypothetical protein